jgi:hypothetical protein
MAPKFQKGPDLKRFMVRFIKRWICTQLTVQDSDGPSALDESIVSVLLHLQFECAVGLLMRGRVYCARDRYGRGLY